MVQVILQIIQRIELPENVLGQLLMIAQDFLKRVWRKSMAALQVQEFTEGESSEVIYFGDAAKLGVLFFQTHDRRTGKDDTQLRKAVVADAQVVTPVGILEHLVNEKHLASFFDKPAGEIHQTVLGKIKVVHVDVQTGRVGAELFLGVLQQESCLAYTSRALDADQSVVPVDLVHQAPANGGIGMLHQIAVCPVK